jgi:hypothetical protein
MAEITGLLIGAFGLSPKILREREKKLTDSFSYDTNKVLIEKVGIQNGGIAD